MTKRLAKNPALWIVLILLVGFGIYQFSNVGGYQQIDTSDAQTLIVKGQVESAKLTPDTINLTLKDGQSFSGDGVKKATRVQSNYVSARGDEPGGPARQEPAEQGVHR